MKANPKERRNYIICAQGNAFEVECKTGQCFDEKQSTCSKCSDIYNEPDDETSNYCKKEENNLHRLPNDKDCNSYFLCVNNAAEYVECPKNQHFSTKHKKCMNYAEAECDYYTKWCKNRKEGTKFTAKKCYEYYECRGEETLLKSCKYNEYFDANTEKCVTGICRTDDRVPNCKLQKDGKQFPHPKCYKYYMCLNKTPREIQCGTGFYYNTVYEKCVIDVNNVCNDD